MRLKEPLKQTIFFSFLLDSWQLEYSVDALKLNIRMIMYVCILQSHYFRIRLCFNILMQGFGGCCEDPVMHERITKEIKQWLSTTAPGVRSTEGCTKKHYLRPSLGEYPPFKTFSILILHVQMLCFQNAVLAGPTVLTPATATGALITRSSCLRQERSVRGSVDTWPRYMTGTPTTS